MTKLSVRKLYESLDYDSETGIFTRRKTSTINPKVKVGMTAGYQSRDGYLYICIGNGRYLAHRLAWLYLYGKFPKNDIDHINGVKNDNRIANLREATRSQNNANSKTHKHNSSGVKGVCFDKTNKKWLAYLQIDGRFKNLGRFESFDEAVSIRRKTAKIMFGEFAKA